jgi:hypothetical protein
MFTSVFGQQEIESVIVIDDILGPLTAVARAESRISQSPMARRAKCILTSVQPQEPSTQSAPKKVMSRAEQKH